jgi:mannitol/fructose-specific phosphotransferase system IIA component (Ntr-type)
MMTLSELLLPEAVRTHVTVDDWRTAIRDCGELLVTQGAVEPRYVEAMLAAFDELGPYAVVSPGVALPHARPSDGVRRPGIAIITLAEPVTFGHTHNDPVDVVVAFAATDKTTHLEVLRQLAEILGDENSLGRVRAADDAASLLDALTVPLEDLPDDAGERSHQS